MAVGLWHRAGLEKNRTVRLSTVFLEHDLGVQKDAKRRALDALEGDGLISIERHTGRSPVVTILDVEPEPSADDREVVEPSTGSTTATKAASMSPSLGQ